MMTLRCPSYAADRWLSKVPRPSSLLLGPPAVEVRSSGEGRGLGLFATRTIPAFCQILSDAPLILMKPNEDLPELYQQFTNLSAEDQNTYSTLNYHENPSRDALLKDKLLQRGFGQEGLGQMAKVAGIMQTNAFNVDLQDGQGSRHRALFPTIARINHSCAPNSHVCFYPPSEQNHKGRMVIHSLRKLEAGEEVLISYFSILLSRAERQQKAQKWGFNCNCMVCEESSPEHDQREKQRKAIREFKARHESTVHSYTSTMKSISSLIKKGSSIVAQAENCYEVLPAVPELYDGLGLLHARALVVQKREMQRQDVIMNHEKAVIWEARITGQDSQATQNRLQKLVQFAGRKDGRSLPRIGLDDNGTYVVQWQDG